MKKKAMFCCIVIAVFSFLLFLGCSPDPEKELTPIEQKEGDIETETYIVGGEELTITTKIYNLAEPNEEEVLIELPLDSGDDTVNAIKEFMDQTSASASQLKAYADNFYMSVNQFFDIAKGDTSKNRSRTDTAYDELDDLIVLDELLKHIQQTFGEYEVGTLNIVLRELELSVKEFDSICKEEKGDDYLALLFEEFKTPMGLYNAYMNSGKNSLEEFLAGYERRIAVSTVIDIIDIGIDVLVGVAEWMYKIYANDAAIPEPVIQPKTFSVISQVDSKKLKLVSPTNRFQEILKLYPNSIYQRVPIAYDARGVHIYFNIDNYYGASREGLPGAGNSWIPKIGIAKSYVRLTHACPIYSYHIIRGIITFSRPTFNSITKVPTLYATIDVDTLLKLPPFCWVKKNRGRKFTVKFEGNKPLKVISVVAK